MKMKLRDIANPKFMVALKSLMRLTTVPASTSFKIRGIAKTLGEEIAKYESVKESYVEEFGQRDEENILKVQINPDGSRVFSIKPDMRKIFDVKMKETNDLIVDIQEITRKELGEKDPALTPEDYFFLEFLTPE